MRDISGYSNIEFEDDDHYVVLIINAVIYLSSLSIYNPSFQFSIR